MGSHTDQKAKIKAILAPKTEVFDISISMIAPIMGSISEHKGFCEQTVKNNFLSHAIYIEIGIQTASSEV